MKVRGEQLWIAVVAGQMSDEIRQHVSRWPSLDQRSVGKQIITAADSVGANIVEAHGRQHAKEIIQFLCIARASLEETRYWLERAQSRGLLKTNQKNHLSIAYFRINQGITNLIRHKKTTPKPAPP